jgi:hypothetical protein
MITIKVNIQNLDTLRSNFAKAPALALSYISKATQASIFEIEKQAVDTNFQFKTSRAKRTGYLQLSFQYGRYIAPSGLYGYIGPTAYYAPYVYYGTSRGIRSNRYMDRIAAAAEPYINKHFGTAVEKFSADLARV